MWSIVRPAALQAARVTGATGSLPARHGLGWLSARVVLNRSASCAYRLTVVARSLATATAKAKTARKPAATATKATATKPKARATAAKKLATKKPAIKTAKSAKATKTTKGARAAKPKAKSKAAKPKKAAKARKPAKTPEEKLASDKRKLAKSTLSVPTQLPSNSWLVYLKQKIQGKHFNVTQETPTLSKSFKELPAAEVENLKETARANVELNKAAYKAWVESHTPAEVHAANKARSRLRRVHKVSKSMIKDPRLPKRPMTPFFFYIQKGFTPRDPALVKVTDHAKAAASQWNTLGTAERKPFIDMAIADRSRYEVEKKNVGLL